MNQIGTSQRRRFVTAASVLALLSGIVVAPTLAATPASAVTYSDVLIQPVNARSSGSLVARAAVPAATDYHWLITADDVGNPDDAIARCQAPAPYGTGTDPAYPENCQWPSIRQTPGAVPIVAQGDQTQLNATTPLTGLPAGNYLISVLADGYTLGGAHFSVPMPTAVLDVPVQPNPVPLGTLRVRVFHDNSPVDATYEAGSETGAQGGQQSLAGFAPHLTDVLGEVTTDWYGNPLCTNYVHVGGKVTFDDTGSPVIDAADPGGKCLSDAAGDIVVPNLGSNRYGVTLSKPADKADWVQTTTLEGSHDHDVWVMNADTGLDTEMVIGGEPVPWVQFGYIEPKTPAAAAGTAHVTGQVLAGLTYVGGNGGITIPGGTGTAGGKEGPPIKRPWVSLSDLGNGDQMFATERGNADGTFDIGGVPDGTYQLTAWDDEQDYIIFSINVTVANHTNVDTGKTYLSGWTQRVYGTVFIDSNENGRQDPGEQGLPRTAVTLRERDNSLIDQFTNTVTTDANGRYSIVEAYPLTKWLVLEHFNTRYEGTGITFQGENDPSATTIKGAAVDVNVLPVLGLGGRVDWGVKPYAPGTNGGIVGTVTYDTTRNELDPAYSVTETYQPGIPGIPVHLYAVVRDPVTGDPVTNTDGSVKRGPELATAYTSATWSAPKGCTARQWDGTVLTGLSFIPAPGMDANRTCVESPAMGFQVMPSDNTDGAFGQTVNGNYGFSTSDLNLYPPNDPSNPAPDKQLPLYADLTANGYAPQPLTPDDYVVSVDIPNDPVDGRPMYQVTREEDVNVFDGDTYLPTENFPVSTDPTTNPPNANGGRTDPPAAPPSQGGGLGVSPCVGPNHTVNVTDQAFLDGGGSPYQGQPRNLCTDKLVTVRGQQAVAPNFNLFTPVPIPTHFWGLTINDLGLSWDKRSIQYGEAQGLPGVPMGIYDFSGNLLDTVKTDFNGFYEAIEPSTSSFNCPLPAGPCPGMYRFVGNDPGQPGRPNPGYNPRYRTIATNFQAWPGLYTVTDTAPTQVGAVVVTPGTTTPRPVTCDVSAATPEFFAISSPWVPSATSANRTLTVRGQHFGSRVAPNAGGTTGSRAELVGSDGTPIDVTPTSGWTDTSVTFSTPPLLSAVGGSYQLRLRNGVTGRWTSSAITVQIRGLSYLPTVRHVGPGQSYATIQAAINASSVTASGNTLILVHPGATGPFNPLGAYFENLVVNRRVKLQGYGPGGQAPGGPLVPGSVIDGQAFDADGASGTAWFATVASRQHLGPVGVPDGAVITELPSSTTQFTAGGNGNASIDGFRITGGYQQNVTGNLNAITGANVTGFGAPGAEITQGGGVYVHAYARNLQVTNNLILGNSGSYAGAIRVGTPYAVGADGNPVDSSNDSIRVSYNRIRDNGGTNLAGGIGIFSGSRDYSVDHNDICGNFSAEYGGGISHFGRSPGGQIDHNRMWFNESYDEGGAVMVAGELTTDPNALSPGSGRVTVSANEIVVNTANDDGGGLRLLMVGNDPIRVENNILADNLSTHEGAGIALDDATNVELVNNTVARNITTATAVTSDGKPAAAGLSTGRNSTQLQATLPAGSPTFSNPRQVDNVFWENMAGSWDGVMVHGIGLAGDTATVNFWDMGATDGSGPLTPRYSVLTTPNAGQATAPTGGLLPGMDVPVGSTATSPPWYDVITSGNASVKFVNPYSVGIDVSTLRTFPGFRQSVILARNLPPDLQGDYHLASGSVAVGLGVALLGPVAGGLVAPHRDIEGNLRYAGLPYTGPAVNPVPKRIESGGDERP
jgi:hypothetical protein